MTQKYCKNCKQLVNPKKNFHGVAFILLILFVWFPLLSIEFFVMIITYLPYYTHQTASVPLISTITCLMLIITFLFPFVYVGYHIFGKVAKCPICNDINFEKEIKI